MLPVTNPPSKKPIREEQIGVRLLPEGLEAIDKMRGNWSRPEWMRQAAALAIKQGLKGPNGAL